MKKEKIKQILTLTMLGFFITSNLTNFNVKATSESNKNNEIASVNINPVPQKTEYTGDNFEITTEVNIIGADVADNDAVRSLNSLLTENNITINDSYDSSDTTIILGEVNDNIQAINMVKEELNIDDSNLNKEGYNLITNDFDLNNGVIVIEGVDEKGTFYGIKTLEQLLKQENNINKIQEVSISDYPTMEWRGVVEGFYGNPWTHEDRLDQLKFYGDNKMNMYIYAPKDDPYHRDKWREPYPESELERMGELINTAKENKVEFIFAISPGLDLRFDGEEGEADFQALLNKAESLYDMGVRSFSILWDDIDTLEGVKQAEFLNRFNREFMQTKEDVNKLVTVPTQYWTDYMIREGVVSQYTSDFSRILDKDIHVMWTGYWIIPQGISVEEAKAVTDVYKKKMGVWWNYPVTDYRKEKLALGPIYQLDNNLDDEVDFLALNPMEHAELSKISIYTGADYAWNTKTYDYNKSWHKALNSLFGELAEDFKYFANHSTRLTTGRADAPEMRALIDCLWAKLLNKQDATNEINTLYKEFEKMEKVSDNLKLNLPKEILEECTNQLDYFKELAQYDKLALDMIIALLNNNMNEWWLLKNQSLKQLEVIEGAGKAKLSEDVAGAFVKEAHDNGNILYNKLISSENNEEIKYTPSTNIKPKRFTHWYYNVNPYEIENIVSNNLEKAFVSEETIKQGDYIQIDLGKIENIQNIYLLQGKTAADNVVNGVLEYSVDGETWTEIEENNGDFEFLVDNLNIEARYIRYTSKDNTEFPCFFRDFKVNKENILNEKIYINNKKVEGIIKRNVEDSNPMIHGNYLGIFDIKEEDTFTIELRDFKYINSIETDFKGLKGNIEYSKNNMDWITVNEGNLNEEVVAKYIRFKATEDGEILNPSFRINLQGNINTKFISNYSSAGEEVIDYDLTSSMVIRKTKNGDYSQIDLGEVTKVRDIRLAFDEYYKNDRYIKAKVEYSIDGETWIEIPSDINSWYNEIRDLDILARYIKVTNLKDNADWTRVADLSVNVAKAEPYIESTVKGLSNNRLVTLNDKDLSTSYIPERELENEDSLTYRLYDNKNIDKIHILQNPEKISNAKVLARTITDEVIELGYLDKAYTILDVPSNMEIESIKLEFNENKNVEIYEITPELLNEKDILVCPTKIKNINGQSTSNSITLTWDAPQNSTSLESYSIYKDGILIKTIPAYEKEFTIKNLESNRLYGFKVLCNYKNGEKSRPVSKNVRTLK